MVKYKNRKDALILIAYSKLNYLNKPTNKEDILFEASRISRIIAEHYTHSKIDKEYNDFVLDFLRVHYNELIYGNAYDYDIDLPDDRHELDVNVIINKWHRNQNKLNEH